MHPFGGTSTRDRAWQPTPEVAEAIRRAAAMFASRKGAVSVLNRGGRSALQGLRIAICDDSPIFLAGLATALVELGACVAHQALDSRTLEQCVERGRVDVVIVDIAQPPTFTVEGIATARTLRDARPGFPTLLLSSNVAIEGDQALSAFHDDCSSLGYLRKDRLAGGAALANVLALILDGGTVIDASLVAQLMTVTHEDSTLDALSARERETLQLVAQGLTNAAIARHMCLSPKTVETNIASLFNKLGLPVEESVNRRVLATLTYLRAEHAAKIPGGDVT